MARRVMVVEDEEEILRFVRLLLTSEGYEVITARAGREALAKALDEPPDLLIADLMLPDIDGAELCRRYRAGVESAAPVVLMTGAPHDERVLLAAPDSILPKPFDIEALLDIASKLLPAE